jgi:hypothetical protein
MKAYSSITKNMEWEHFTFKRKSMKVNLLMESFKAKACCIMEMVMLTKALF